MWWCVVWVFVWGFCLLDLTCWFDRYSGMLTYVWCIMFVLICLNGCFVLPGLGFSMLICYLVICLSSLFDLLSLLCLGWDFWTAVTLVRVLWCNMVSDFACWDLCFADYLWCVLGFEYFVDWFLSFIWLFYSGSMFDLFLGYFGCNLDLIWYMVLLVLFVWLVVLLCCTCFFCLVYGLVG